MHKNFSSLTNCATNRADEVAWSTVVCCETHRCHHELHEFFSPASELRAEEQHERWAQPYPDVLDIRRDTYIMYIAKTW